MHSRDWDAVAAQCAPTFQTRDHRLLGWGTMVNDADTFVRVVRSAVERQLEILGEACGRALADAPDLREPASSTAWLFYLPDEGRLSPTPPADSLTSTPRTRAWGWGQRRMAP